MSALFLSERRSKRTKRIELSVLNFLEAHDVAYHIHSGLPGVYTCYFRIDETVCIEQEIHIREDDCLCYTNLSRNAKCLGRNWQQEILHRINSINRTLDYGNFEVDSETGDIRYRTYFSPGNAVYLEDLDQFLGYPMQVIRNQHHQLLDCL